MARFLLAFVHNTNPNSLEYSQEIFQVSEQCTSNDVTVPMNTIFFSFITANVKNAKELAESFITIKIGNKMISTTSITITYENNGKRYWIGKIISAGYIQYIYNEHANVIIPFTNLVGNDEVIDL